MRGIFLIAVVFLLYFVSVFGGFVQDDGRVIEQNTELGTARSLVESWTEPYYVGDPRAGAYRPVTSFSFSLNALVLGNGAWGFRLVNIVLYALLCWLIYVFLRSVDIGSHSLPFWIALLFAVHPIHTEVVNNIVGRSEILALIFVLLMILMANKKKWEISIFMYLLAVLSKESAIGFIAILMVFVWKEKMRLQEKVGITIYSAISLIGYFILRFMVLGKFMFSNNASIVENPLKFVDFGQRILGAFSTLTMGISKLILPINLSYDYSFNQIPLPTSVIDFRVIMGIGVTIFSGVYLYRFRLFGMTKYFGVLVGMLLFWLPIMVTGNFVFATGTIFGERLWLTPSLGFLIVVMVPFRGIKWRILTMSVVVMVVLFGVRTVTRNFDWLSEKRLFLHDVKYSNRSVMASSNEAVVWLSEKNFEKARIALEKAESIYPKYPVLMNNWGIYYWWKGDLETAEKKFELCIKEYPNLKLCKSNLSVMLDESSK